MKNLLKNRARPEGSIARAYLESEVLAFCSSYTDNDVDKIPEFDGPTAGDTSVFMHGVRLIGKNRVHYFDDKTINLFVWYVLNNTDKVEPYLE